jgi:hypothetical protein
LIDGSTSSHIWFTAPSGTAGDAISFTQAMDLANSGGASTLTVNSALNTASAMRLTTNGGLTAGMFLAAPSVDHSLGFQTAGTEKMRLDSSGNLLVGTTSGAARVHAYSGTAMTQITADGTGAIKTGVNFANGGTTYGQIYFDNNSPYDMSVFQQYTTGSLRFGTNDTERARITSGGELLVGTTSASGSNSGSFVFVSGTGSFDGVALFQHSTSNVDGSGYINFNYNGSAIGSISQNGTTAVAYNTSSDYRLKNITGPITTSGAYIDSLNPVEGTWKADGSTFVGLIAHEVQEASRTNVATGVKDGEEMQGMDYSSAEIIANLIAEIQSLRARLAAANI